jgi:hypothetical protein
MLVDPASKTWVAGTRPAMTIHAIVMAGLVPAIHDLSLLPFAAYLTFIVLAKRFTFSP